MDDETSFPKLKVYASELIFEISQKFFNHYNLVTNMFIANHDFEKIHKEHILFSIVLNLFQNEKCFQERKSKKNVKNLLIFL